MILDLASTLWSTLTLPFKPRLTIIITPKRK